MTHDEILDYAREYKTILGLDDWKIEILLIADDTIDGDSSAGSCARDVNYKTSTIRVATKRDDDFIKDTVIHELLHILTIEMINTEDRILSLMHGDAKTLAKSIFLAEEEKLIARLAKSFLTQEEKHEAVLQSERRCDGSSVECDSEAP